MADGKADVRRLLSRRDLRPRGRGWGKGAPGRVFGVRGLLGPPGFPRPRLLATTSRLVRDKGGDTGMVVLGDRV